MDFFIPALKYTSVNGKTKHHRGPIPREHQDQPVYIHLLRDLVCIHTTARSQAMCLRLLTAGKKGILGGSRARKWCCLKPIT